MVQDAGMLAALFGRSMGLDDTREVAETWFDEVDGGADEPHVRVARVRGKAVPRPECGRRRGARDTRERAWRHLGIWQLGTYARCAVPRAGRPERGVRTAPVPREVRPDPRLAAPFGARVPAARMGGSTVRAVSESLGEGDRRLRDMLRRAVSQARDKADYSLVRRVGAGETSRAKGHTHISTMPGPGGRRRVAVTDGNDKGAVARMCGQLEARGGDRSAIEEATRDMGGSFSAAVAAEMPQATQTIDRLRVMRLLSRATDGARRAERRGPDGRREMLKRTKHVWLKREGSLAGRQRETRERLAPGRSHLRTARARQMTKAMRDACSCADAAEAGPELDRLASWMMHSNVPEMRGLPGPSARTGRASSTTSAAGSPTPASRARTP